MAAPALAGLVTGYHCYRAEAAPGVELHDAFFPSWATIRIAAPGSPSWALQLGSRRFEPVPAAVFVGPTSYAGYMTCSGGELFGVGILPLGWATLFGGDLSRYANRAVPLSMVAPDAAKLVEALAEPGCDRVAAFDRWLQRRQQSTRPVDETLKRLCQLLDDETLTRAEALAEALGIAPRALAALTRFSFGFTPKLLLRRRRFLKALSLVLTDQAGGSTRLHEVGYFDRSHFLRDSHLFLGCSIREFNRRIGPMARMAMQVRTQVMGAPV